MSDGVARVKGGVDGIICIELTFDVMELNGVENLLCPQRVLRWQVVISAGVLCGKQGVSRAQIYESDCRSVSLDSFATWDSQNVN